MSDKTFPNGFYWGASAASYQVEGGIENTDWAKAAREGRVPVCGRACDHYNRYEQDFDLAKELGHNAHRFSLEWARIEPEEGKFDDQEIEHYRQVIRALKSRGIRPYTTLWHFTLPLWFSERGGFERKDAPEIFARFAKYVAEKLGDDLEGISTINEPMVVGSQGWLTGEWPPFKRVPFVNRMAMQDRAKKNGLTPKVSWHHLFLYFFRVEKNFIRSHNAAYDAIKSVRPEMEVSIVKHTVFFHSDSTPLNRLKAKFMNWYWTYRFMDQVAQKCDSIGVNYYQHKKFGDTESRPRTDMNWEIYPEGIEGALKLLWKYKKPLFVSEAGIADAADQYRADYIKRQVQATGRAIADGVDVRGHMYWSLLDNYEWALGFEKRFGLIEIDYDTLERKVRPSAYVYKKIIEGNGIVE
jgi:beta-glucosidase